MSNQFEILQEALFLNLSQLRKAPPKRIIVAIPSNRIKDFIMQEAIKRWGVFHCIRFAKLEETLSLLFTLAHPNEPTLLSGRELSLHIEDILRKTPLFSSYIRGDEKKIAPLSRTLGLAFYKWGWEGGELFGENKLLLDILKETIDFPCLTLKLLTKPKIPYEVHLFGINRLPKIALSLLNFYKTKIYFSSPTPYYWGDLLSDALSAKLDQKFQKENVTLSERHAFDSLVSDRNPELANWSGYAKPFYTYCIEKDFLDAYEELEGSSTLAFLQQDVYHFTQRDDLIYDESLQCIEAPSPFVEVEFLHSYIKKWIREEAALPEDILILTPNLPLYAPYIELIFGDPASPIGFHIAEIKGVRQNSPLYIVDLLFSLSSERFSKEAIVTLISSPYFASEAFSLRQEDFRLFHFLVESLNIQWGYDLKMCQDVLKETEVSDKNTWQRAFHTLLETLPYKSSPLSLSEIDSLAKWMTLIESLYEDVGFLEKSFTLHEIYEKVKTLLAKYIKPALEIDSFLQRMGSLIYPSDTPFPFSSLRELVQEGQYSLASKPPRPRISFHPLEEGATTPHPIICLLGLDEESFPKVHKSSHLSRSIYKDDAAIEKDKFLFLQALLSARKRLYLSYSAIDSDGKPLSHSLLLTPLFERIAHFKIERPSLPPLPLAPKLEMPDILLKNPLEDKVIAFTDLTKVARHPIQYYSQNVLGVFLEEKKEMSEFILSSLEKALLSREFLEGKSREAILEEALSKNKLPSHLFLEGAKRELTKEVDSLEEGLKSHSLSPQDLTTIYFSEEIKGKLPYMTKEGLFIPKAFSIAELWKHLPHLFMLGTRELPTTLLFKDGNKKEFSLKNPKENLSLFLEYFRAATKEISPLLPERISPLIKGDKEKFLLLVQSEPFFPDPYLDLFKPNLIYPWEKHVEELWRSLE